MNQLIPRLNLAAAMIIVGSSVVAGKIMIQGLPVFAASLLRFLLAAAVLVPLVRLGEGGLPSLSRRSLAMLALQSLCGSVLFTVCLLYGLKLTSPGAAGIITSTTPACMALLVWIFIKTPPSRKAALGILLSVLGVAALNLNGTADHMGHISGNLLVLAAVLFESMFLLMRKTVREPLSPLGASLMVSIFGTLWFLIPGIWELAATDLGAVPAAAWASVVYYALIVTVGAYYFWFAGITRVPASTAGVFTAVMPVSAILLSGLVLAEPITAGQLAGCGLVVSGIVMISR